MFNFVINYDLPNTVEEYVRRIAYVNTFAQHHTMISFFDQTVDRDAGVVIANYLINVRFRRILYYRQYRYVKYFLFFQEGLQVPEFLLSRFVEDEIWPDDESI